MSSNPNPGGSSKEKQMNAITKSTSVAVLVTLGLALAVGAGPLWAEVKLPDRPEPCVEWAAQEVLAALQKAGVPPATADIPVAVDGKGMKAESFDLAVQDGRVTVMAQDAVGAMYGLLELAEQIGACGLAGEWAKVAAALKSTRQAPFLEYRADNPMLQTPGKGTSKGGMFTLNDVDMWKRYIDQLARARFNVLDWHSVWGTNSKGGPNLFPLLVHVPEYPAVGNKAEQERSMRDLNAILAHAKARGIRVGLMNYFAGVNGKTFPAGGSLADYQAKAVAALLKGAPELHMLGFRIGESGQEADFHEKTYLKGVLDCGRKDIRLYTRTWRTSKKEVDAIGHALEGKVPFDITIKFNGEHLGLPYHALSGGYHAYSYQNYLNLPEPYGVIWHIWAYGTHRYWAWEDTEFIRRTVRTLTLGQARGFSIQPHIAFLENRAAPYYRAETDQKVYRYIWEKHWMWYVAWGRLAYDPNLPESRLVHLYVQHYGPAGKAVHEAMQSSGWVVPLAYAYRFQGPDHRNVSPETETGCLNSPSSPTAGVNVQAVAKRLIGAIPDAEFAFAVNPMDSRSFLGVDTFVERVLKNEPDGRVNPLQVAETFTDAVRKTRAAVERVGQPEGHAGEEWRLVRTDLLSAAALGEYHAARIRGAVHLRYAVSTGSQTDYDKAVRYFADSRAAWKKLAEIADAVYAPLQNGLRNQWNFTWGSDSPRLETLDAKLPAVWATCKADPAAKPLDAARFAAATGGPEVLDLRSAALGTDKITVRCRVKSPARVKRVMVWWKKLPSELKWVSQPMEAGADQEYSVVLPLTPEGLMYAVEAHDNAGGATVFPQAMNATPYIVIPASASQASP